MAKAKKTPEYPTKDPYEYADKVTRALARRFIRLFANANLLPFDELNVLHGVRGLYEEVYEILKEAFLRLARKAYADRTGAPRTAPRVEKRITERWLEEQLTAFSPTTKTVFRNDLWRREDLLFEAVMATGNVREELDAALKALTRMVKQEVIEIVDTAAEAADKDNKVERVIWLTQLDARVCTECAKLEGEIFKLEDVPRKPHRNCRCWRLPWPFEGD